MKIAYLDCFAGISGDMFLGALVDAGVPQRVLEEAVTALGLGASLTFERVDRSGIMATKVHVLEGDRLAEEAGRHAHAPAPGEVKDAGGLPQQERTPEPVATHRHFPKTQHQHKTGHPHTHDPAHMHDHEDPSHDHDPSHEHVHGRSLNVIRMLIESSELAEPVKRTAIKAFELLGVSEAKIHGVPVEEIHFHEVGAVDAIVDIVASCAGIHHLQIGAWYSSPLNVGGGMVQCAHGLFPVPAPATADLLRGLPTYSAHIQKELVTPTGAALIRALSPKFGAQPAMAVDRIGYGAGTRNPKEFPNVLRLAIGETADGLEVGATENEREAVAVLETALDDLSPQVIAYVAEQALAHGALDVMLTPVTMKKGRAGTLVTVLCAPADALKFEALLLRETSTLGVRVRMERRSCLDREHVEVKTAYGAVRVKVGRLAGEELNAQPEFEDCRRAAGEHQVALKTVQQAAMSAYREEKTK